MKTLWTLAVAALCFMAVMPAQAGEKEIAALCLSELSKQDPMGIDVPAYCACLGQRLARHEGKLTHSDGQRVRTQVINDLGPCFDKHMKPPVTNLCNGFNEQMQAQKQKVKMDCSCYYSKVIDNFGAAWAGNLTNTPIPAEEQTALAQAAVANCARELP